MPYVNKPRPYKKEYQQQLERGEGKARLERQRARAKIDKTGKDANNNGEADAREGKDVAHVKALSKGGSNKDGVRIESVSANRSFKRGSKPQSSFRSQRKGTKEKINMEILDNKQLLIRTRRPHLVTEQIQGSTVLSTTGDIHEVSVNWGLPEAQTLNQLKIKNVPSPIKRDYDWPRPMGFTPFVHQRETASFLTLNKKAFCFNEQGTGKTASVIWASDYLMDLGLVKRVLVVCPLSIMESAWREDLFKFAIHRTVDVAHGSRERRKKVIDGGAEYIIINFDGIGTVLDTIAQGGFDMIVVDEASAYKNSQTDRWKIMNSLSKAVDWLWMLTGTPAAQSPVDAYGLAKLVNPDNVPKWYGQFSRSGYVQDRYVQVGNQR